jgi:hypothetical protein
MAVLGRTLYLATSQLLDQSRIYLKRAMQSPTALSHQIASEMSAYYSKRNPKKALAEADTAIALNKNDPAGACPALTDRYLTALPVWSRTGVSDYIGENRRSDSLGQGRLHADGGHWWL